MLAVLVLYQRHHILVSLLALVALVIVIFIAKVRKYNISKNNQLEIGLASLLFPVLSENAMIPLFVTIQIGDISEGLVAELTDILLRRLRGAERGGNLALAQGYIVLVVIRIAEVHDAPLDEARAHERISLDHLMRGIQFLGLDGHALYFEQVDRCLAEALQGLGALYFIVPLHRVPKFLHPQLVRLARLKHKVVGVLQLVSAPTAEPLWELLRLCHGHLLGSFKAN